MSRITNARRIVLENRNWIEEQAANGVAHKEISAKLGVSEVMLKKQCKGLGIRFGRKSARDIIIENQAWIEEQAVNFKSVSDIANSLGVNLSTLSQFSRELGINYKRKSAQQLIKDKINWITKQAKNKRSVKQIAEDLNVDRSTLTKSCRELGVDLVALRREAKQSSSAS